MRNTTNDDDSQYEPPSDEEDEEEVELPPIKAIWDDEYIERCNVDDTPGWKCLWCQDKFKGVNATKALAHVSKAKDLGQNVRMCKSTIAENYKKRYKDMASALANKRSSKKRVRENLDNAVESSQTETTAMHIANKPRKYRKIDGGARKSGTMDAFVRPAASNSSGAASSTSTAVLHQPTLEAYQNDDDEGIDKVNEATLSLAIADLIHCEGLAFSLAESARFRRVLKLARCVGSSFRPPNRKAVGGELLDLNHERCLKANDELLLKEADTFGLAYMGDGATIRRSPFLNILGSSVSNPVTELEIVDCHDHLADGGKKDATYIASTFVPHLERHDPDKELTELILFDGAGNVQKGGRIIEAMYPRVTCLHGAEHGISLFFSDVAKLPEIKVRRGVVSTCFQC